MTLPFGRGVTEAKAWKRKQVRKPKLLSTFIRHDVIRAVVELTVNPSN
jgi:hypothetical protein